MNSIFKIILILWFFSLFACCKSSITNFNGTEIETKYVEQGHKENLSEIAESIKYIPLETSHEILLGSIEQAIISDKIYCLQSKKINVFDLSGNALFEINHSGKKGPEGYRDISTFQVDSINSLIEIWDRFSSKIVRFDSNTGGYINSQRFNCSALSFLKNSNGHYYFYTGAHPNSYVERNSDEIYYILEFDKKGKFIRGHIKIENENKLVLINHRSILNHYRGSFYFSPPADNKIYTLQDQNWSKLYELNFGKRAINEEYFKGLNHWGVRELSESNFAWHLGGFREYDQGYYYMFSLESMNVYRSFVSKSSGKAIVVDRYFRNDFDGDWNFDIQFVQESIFFSCYDAYVIKRIYQDLMDQLSTKNWKNFQNEHKEFCIMGANIQETDNPVIVQLNPRIF